MTLSEQFAVACRAGVATGGMRLDEKHGVLITQTGLLQLRAIAAGKFNDAALTSQVARLLRARAVPVMS
jgi:hypothetical protein